MENGIFDYLRKFNGQRFEERLKACGKRNERGKSQSEFIMKVASLKNERLIILDKQFSFGVRSSLFGLFVPIAM